jgi:6-pyruvoyltetrahydropterin/6-carboxytetrahydropterin synthase
MNIISKQFRFEAAHQLSGMPDGHQCARLHGHSYQVEIFLASNATDSRGMVKDYGELEPFAEYVKSRFDHRFINEEVDFNPTAENLARHFYFWIQGEHGDWPLLAVRVRETEKTAALYCPRNLRPIF